MTVAAAEAARTVRVFVPEGFADPRRASGGNVYDQRIVDGLRDRGWEVRVCETDSARTADAMGAVHPGDLVLVDGLIAVGAPAAVEAAAARTTVVLLAHMVSSAFPDAGSGVVEAEHRVLRAVRGVIATSEWTRDELMRRDGIPSERISVAPPGAATAPAARGTSRGAALLCVGVLAPHKGQDVLIEALRDLDPDVPWTCTFAGSPTAFPSYAERIAALVSSAGIGERVRMPGLLTPEELDAAYRDADVVVAPSRVESYGMAIADALGRGIPVIGTTAGGIPRTVGASGAAILVPPDEPAALAEALRRWMADGGLRTRMRSEALRVRATLPRWSDTVDRVSAALEALR